MIKTSYDPEADVLHVIFGRADAKYDSSVEVAPGVSVEFDGSGAPIGLEVLSVGRRAAEHSVVIAAAAE